MSITIDKSTLEYNINTNNEDWKDWKDWKDFPNIKEPLMQGIFSYGFEYPSLIQKKTYSPIQTGKDIIAQSQSGTGKTGAYLIGALQKMNVEKDETGILILSPTRELALQIHNVIKELSKYMNLHILLCIGGHSVYEDIDFIDKHNPNIVVGCCGRILDLLDRKKLCMNKSQILILDEADELLSDGFKDKIYDIFQFLPENIQVLLFSATLPDEMKYIISKFMRDPIHLLMERSKLSLEGIKQYMLYIYNQRDKIQYLKDIFKTISCTQTIIYCNNVNQVIQLYKSLKKDNYSVTYIHSKMKYEERNKIFESFKRGSERILISTDITARGIDIQQVSVVINYDFPRDKYTYLHRIGRSGRWGRKGTAINFITKQDKYNLKNVEKYYNIFIDTLPDNIEI